MQVLLTVSLSLSPATVLDLEAREVRVRLDFFDEGHLWADSRKNESSKRIQAVAGRCSIQQSDIASITFYPDFSGLEVTAA